jgi:hypothetical protein
MTLLGQDRPPATAEIARAYESKAAEYGSRIVFWEKRHAIISVCEVRGWDVRFKRLNHETVGSVRNERFEAIAKKAGVCRRYGATQVSPLGPPPHSITRTVRVDDLGEAACK